MSRCLAFPPPGYARNGVSGEPLLQLIKVRREEAKAERKKRKEERRRKRMEELEEGEILQKKPNRSKTGEKTSETAHETQVLERKSCLTKDFRQPMFVCPYDSYSNSQSIGWNNHTWYSYGCHNYGSTTWLDFHMVSPSIHPEGSFLQRESQFGGYWIPGPLEFADFEFEDQDWLYRRKHPNYMRETPNARSYELWHGNSTIYPHAKYFPPADIYAYPYAIPY